MINQIANTNPSRGYHSRSACASGPPPAMTTHSSSTAAAIPAATMAQPKFAHYLRTFDPTTGSSTLSPRTRRRYARSAHAIDRLPNTTENPR